MAKPLLPVLASALLAGCATFSFPPPVTTYAAQGCAGSADLGRAVALLPDRRRAQLAVRTPVDAATPCLGDGAARTPYVVYALPDEPVRMIEVGGQIEPSRIFSPTVVTLDEHGSLVRSFAPDQYLYRGELFSVQLVPQPGERFILVTADLERIGRHYDAVAISTQTTTIATPYAVANWTSGVDRSISRTFSYEGSVVVVVHRPETE
jgi:hypothetical protein